MSDSNDSPEERLWEVGWDGHEAAQRRRMANLTLRQKVEWLEEAQHLVERIKAGRPHRSPLRKFLFGLLMALLMLSVTIMAGEVLARLFPGARTDYGFHPDSPFMNDSLIGRRHVPGARGSYRMSEFTSRFSINDEGFRSSAEFRTRDESTRVVAILGDSFTEAFQVDEAQTFASQLEVRLRPEGITQTQNYGMSGTGIVHYLLTYRHHASRHRPELVVICVCEGNDIRNSVGKPDPTGLDAAYVYDDQGRIAGVGPFHFPGPAPVRRPEATPANFIRRHSALYRLMAIFRARNLLTENLLTGFPVDAFVFEDPWSAAVIDQWKYSQWALSELVQEIRGDSAQPLVVLFPVNWTTSTPVWNSLVNRYRGTARLDRDRVRSQLAGLTGDLRVPYLDLSDAFRREDESGRPPHYRLDGHMNPWGHQLAAAAIRDVIREEGLLR